MGGKGKAPKPPDYAQAAVAQGAANKETAIAEAQLANANVTTPQGTQTVSYRTDPVTGNPVPYINQAYSPQQQGLYDKDIAIQNTLADIGLAAAPGARQALSKPVSFDGAPGMPGDAASTRTGVIDAMMARTNSDLGRRREQTRSDLVAAGLAPGSDAYGREMELIDRAENDARNQAMLSAGQEAQRDYTMDMGRRQQGISEILAQRSVPLNEISALRTGSQVAPLGFSGAQGANVAPPDLMGAAGQQYQGQLDQYNAKAGASNQFWNTAGTLGSAALMFSDRRLKSNIVRIGTHRLGIGVYRYTIFGREQVGVMADEVQQVRPQAVHERDGWLMVDYGDL